LDRLAGQFGLPTARRRAVVTKSQEFLAGVPTPLARLAGDLTRTIEDANRKTFRGFLAARSDWRASLEPTALEALDPSSRLRLGTRLVSDLAAFSREGGEEKVRTAKQELDALKQLHFRTTIRMAALARMEKMLDAIAGWLYLADRQAERSVAQRLVDCESLDLKLPKAEWVDPGPALPAWEDEVALVKTMLAKVSSSSVTSQPALRVGEGAPELEIVPYRGELPRVGSGRPVLLFFWATWCKACKTVVPELLAMARQRNLEVLAITSDSEANLERFFSVSREFPALVARDPAHQVEARLGVRAFPTFVLLDGQGRLASPITNYLHDLPGPSGE
jgi:thiol-disulfide isomerase/thioredoxin